ncbi:MULTISPECIES: glycosyltransferase family 4 protein [Paraburkholderia]|uniref:glycosyltransferase family 4 protein n=1 Tax=Paraburkholderia TaxID=1822464 RepID=UPI002258F1EF|nr:MULTISPECIES: glycosyltransferase family 4 protein [Paraburkholderia]MCX4153065.1 glycosyltransferase family 4 protein [Paraburkholderia aspalathi]MDN7162479.1 glycosyltransferase family 4 protein [Paraburkholderia sp. SECH2]MDQ6390965.1 glycosyltransferase family 4 protein [Paraburkholderia aspalathi]
MANRYVFFATAWSAVNGGINSFNLDLCTAIASIGQSIDVFIERGASKDQSAPPNIKVHELPTLFASFDQQSVKFISSIVPEFSETIWVGHDAISGGAALFAKNSLGGRAAVFHHMDYSNYYYLKHQEVSEKIQTQKHLIKNADIVFGVGPRLFQNARHLRASHLETYEIMPGVPEIPARLQPRQFDYRIAICGRLDPAEDKVKNLTAAVKAAHSCLAQLENRRGSITLIGALPTDINVARLGRDNSVAINSVPYISRRADYFTELQDSDLVLMPSVKEGFGLVAWEAACLGIPVLISRSSGFFEFLKGKGLSELVASVEISGVLPFDEAVIAAQLQQCLTDQDVQKANARKLASEVANFNWKATAERFISLLEGVAERAAAESTIQILPAPKTSPRGEKARTLFLNRDSQAAGFERFEDLLSLTARRRQLLIDKSASTDYSRGQKIKFEYWATFSPQPAYFLFIHHSSNLKQTLKRFAKLLATLALEVPRTLFVLRRDASEPQYIQKIVTSEGIASFVHDYTLKEYLWEFGIDEQFKTSLSAEPPLNYVDQAIAVNSSSVEGTTARELILEKLRGKPEYNAHLVLAAGGMGKTWLCRSIASEIISGVSDKNLVVLIQAENLRNYVQEVGSAHVQVSSVFDLYELHAHSQKSERLYDRGTFELAVIAGNIVLVIDGLDELATVLQERFDLNKFLGSIVALSSSLSSSHILITTRDSLLVDADASIEFGIARYELLGFNSTDWMRYARRRFKNHPNSTEIVNRLNSTLSSSRLKDEGGRVVPFFVDVLCTMFEDETKVDSREVFEFVEDSTPYASNNEITDHVVHSVFRREIRRQTIDLDAGQLISLVSELVSEQGDSFSTASLKHLLDLYYETRAEALLQKISLNPFFQVLQTTIRLRYDFLQSYFRALFLIECLARNLHSPEALNAYAKSNASESPEVAYLRKYYEGRIEQLESQLHILVPKLREYVRNNSEHKRLELGRRAISGVLKIYLETRNFTGTKMSDKIVELLPGYSGNQSIDGLSIYGEFPPMDFNGKTIFNSKFLDYKNFSRSKFVDAKFISCIFENCAGDNATGSSIHLAEFDPNCTLGDVAALVSAAKSNQSLEEQIVESECLTFLRGFFKSGVSYDPKQSWLHFSSKVRGLRAKHFDKLIPEFIVIKAEKASDIHYSLAPEFVTSARKFIDNNYVDAAMKRFIAVVR